MKKNKNNSEHCKKEDSQPPSKEFVKKIWAIIPSSVNVGNFFISCQKGLVFSRKMK